MEASLSCNLAYTFIEQNRPTPDFPSDLNDWCKCAVVKPRWARFSWLFAFIATLHSKAHRRRALYLGADYVVAVATISFRHRGQSRRNNAALNGIVNMLLQGTIVSLMDAFRRISTLAARYYCVEMKLTNDALEDSRTRKLCRQPSLHKFHFNVII